MAAPGAKGGECHLRVGTRSRAAASVSTEKHLKFFPSGFVS